MMNTVELTSNASTPSDSVSVAHRNTPDDYLRALWRLSFPPGDPLNIKRGPKPTAPARIAEALGVSRPSCGEMLNRLEDRGWIYRGRSREAIFTENGKREAMRQVRRMRIVVTMLVDMLQYDSCDAADEAKKLVEGFSDDAIDRLWKALGSPVRTHCGTPIDPDFEIRESVTLTRLADAPAGIFTSTRITPCNHNTIPDELSPGSKLEILQHDEDELVLQSIDGKEQIVVDRSVAEGCWGRTAGVPEIPATAICWATKMLPRSNDDGTVEVVK